MKKLLFVISLALLFSCEEPEHCTTCRHMVIMRGVAFTHSPFTVCGDEITAIDGKLTYVEGGVDVIVCDEQ